MPKFIVRHSGHNTPALCDCRFFTRDGYQRPPLIIHTEFGTTQTVDMVKAGDVVRVIHSTDKATIEELDKQIAELQAKKKETLEKAWTAAYLVTPDKLAPVEAGGGDILTLGYGRELVFAGGGE